MAKPSSKAPECRGFYGGEYFLPWMQIQFRGVPMVGDSLRDLRAAASVGAAPILVRSGNGSATEQQLPPELAHTPVYEDLAAFAHHLMQSCRDPQPS